MKRIGHIVVGRIDYEAGEFTYGNRIALGDLFGDETMTDYQRLKAAYKELYGYSCRWLTLPKRTQIFARLYEGVLYWVKREQEMLDYQPSAEELSAGIKELTKRVGNLTTVKALAKAYSRDPDEVLKWDYAKVFGILYTDLEEHRYEEKYTEVIHAKYRRNNQ